MRISYTFGSEGEVESEAMQVTADDLAIEDASHRQRIDEFLIEYKSKRLAKEKAARKAAAKEKIVGEKAEL